MKRILFLLLICQSAMAVLPSWQPDATERQTLSQSLDARWLRGFQNGTYRQRQSSVDLAGLLLDAVAMGYAPERRAVMLSALAQMQDRNPASPGYGNFLWYQGDSRIVDRNGVEFVTRKLALIWLRYREQLTPTEQAALQPLLELAKTGITRHPVRISYTNIFLMKTWNMIALGEGLSDPELAHSGYRMLADWIDYTRRTGINEYLSPSYYDIDLECLSLIANLSRNEDTRQLARAGLGFFWQEIALNWYAPAMRLGGTHSRDYNRLFNTGGLNRKTARAGWSTDNFNALGPYETYAWTAPPANAAAWLRAPLPRLVYGRWGAEPDKIYTHYLGRHFSIGSSGTGYSSGHDNSPLVINLGGGQDVPVINFFMDRRQDYYGLNKTLEAGSGHMKALHLRPQLSSTQSGSTVEFTATIKEAGPIESVITLPADAEYWLDDAKLDLFTATSTWQTEPPANTTSTRLAVQHQNGHTEIHLDDQDTQAGLGLSQRFAATPGQHYALETELAEGELSLYLNFYNARNQLIGSEHSLRTNGPGRHRFNILAPEGAVSGKAWLYSPIAARTTARIRDLQLTEAGKKLAIFDFQVIRHDAIRIPTGHTLFIRRGAAVAVLQALEVRDSADRNIDFTLYNDGLAQHALRLTARHGNGQARVRLKAMACEGLRLDADFARFRQNPACPMEPATTIRILDLFQ